MKNLTLKTHTHEQQTKNGLQRSKRSSLCIGFVTLCLMSGIACADESTAVAIPSPPTEAASVIDTTENGSSSALSKTISLPSKSCPKVFNEIMIPVNGKLCQVFAADYPATMIFHVPQTPEDVIKNYLAQHANLTQTKQMKAQTLLQSADKNTTLVITADGSGTQVDILVKQPLS